MRGNFDFSGWATKNDLRCSDGLTIRKDAFKHNDGQKVPLVWQHLHDEPSNVLGYAILENRPEGVYTYGKFNNTEKGREAKELVAHGDVNQLSIYANKLKKNGSDVLHGAIREVSLVLAGANPGALIDFPILEHGDYWDEDVEPEEAVIYTGEFLSLEHSEEEKEDEKKEDKTPEEPEEKPIEEDKKEDEIEHEEENKMADEKTVQDVFDELTEEQKNVVYFMIGQALEDAGVKPEEEGEEEDMKHNVFDEETREEDVLSHSEMETIISDAKRMGSLKESFLAHADAYGIENIDWLFPEAKTITNTPDFIKRDIDWVGKFMTGVHKTPFSRVKSLFANITADEARAKGYTKGKKKLDEVFTLLKRTTDPQTVYKKQKLDRDDIIDITDFDVVAWIKGEMRLMLDEEIARAALIGDGRLNAADDKISESHIRPIATDDDLYSIKVYVGNQKADDMIKAIIRARKEYKGSGNPTFYTTEDVLTEMLLLEDNIGRPLYDDEAKLATKLRVKEIVTVPVMENQKVDGDNLLGIVVNPADYSIGADKGGAINMFDDFDIDYNQQKYLIETRCSGALIKPYSAMVVTDGEAPEESGASES